MSPRATPGPGAWGAAGFVLFVHLALSPIVFSHATTEHFEFNKVALLLLAVLALAALGAVRVPLRTLAGDPLALGVLLFTASAGVSTVGSLSPRMSLIGAADSFAGLPTVLACAGLFFATRALCRTPGAARRLLLAPVLGATLASTHAALQLGGWDPMPWTRTASFAGTVRPFATLSHPNFLGAYLAMALPLVAVLGLRARGASRVPFALTALLSGVAVLTSLSRAAWAALAVALGVLVIGGLTLGRRDARLRWGLLLGGLLGGLAALGLALAGGGALSEVFVERARHISDPGARHFIWRAAWQIFLDHPLTGCGLDAFALAFQRHREPAYWLLEWNTTPYRAHSDVLHVLATQGLVGAGAVLVMAVGLVILGRRAWRRAEGEDRWVLLAVFAGLSAFCVQGLVGFTVTATGTLFFTFAGVLSGLGAPAPEEQGRWLPVPTLGTAGVLGFGVLAFNFLGPWSADPAGPGAAPTLIVLALAIGGMLWGAWRAEPVPPSPGQNPHPSPLPEGEGGSLRRTVWVRVLACLGAAAVAYLGVLRPYRANLLAHQGDLLLPVAPSQAVAAFERASTLDPTRDFYFVRLGTSLQHASSLASSPAERTHLLSRALEAFQRAVSLVPADARLRANLGAMLAEFAALGMATPAQVYAAFDEALARDPHDANFHLQAANAALRLGDPATARRYASRASELYPRFGPPRALRGYLALTEGRLEEAAGLLREARAGTWHGDTTAWVAASANLATALLELGHTKEAHQAASEAVAEAPQSAEARFILGRTLERAGARDAALGQYRQALALQPDHAAARAALRGLGVEPGPP